VQQSVTVVSTDDIGKLGTAFNTMAASIRHSTKQLAAEKRDVERKVEDAVRESEAEKELLSASVEQMLGGVGRFAEGDLTVKISASTTANGDITRLFAGFNQAVQEIRALVTTVAGTAEEVSMTAASIATKSEQVLKSAHEETQYVNDIAAAVEETNATISESARQIVIVAEEAHKAEDDARNGGVVVGQAMAGIEAIATIVSRAAHSIEELGKSNEAIGEVTSVIEEIADQTNLLALNAAIEAARAGEQGRGFAVVADEVRKLAERTQKATKEIATTIRTIQNQTTTAVREMQQGQAQVRIGQESAAQAKNALQSIIERVQRVASIIEQVATASEEQSSAMSEIARGVDVIVNITRQSASAMQLTTNDIQTLNQIIGRLQSVIGQFRTENEHSHKPHQTLSGKGQRMLA
jgi:methyl-accepting chemotaxis protein